AGTGGRTTRARSGGRRRYRSCPRFASESSKANPERWRLLRRTGPERALIFPGDRRDALVDEPLHAMPFVGLGGVQVALRIAGDDVDAVELARLPSAVAKRGQLFERVAAQDMNELVFSVADVQVGLLRIG